MTLFNRRSISPIGNRGLKAAHARGKSPAARDQPPPHFLSFLHVPALTLIIFPRDADRDLFRAFSAKMFRGRPGEIDPIQILLG